MIRTLAARLWNNGNALIRSTSPELIICYKDAMVFYLFSKHFFFISIAHRTPVRKKERVFFTIRTFARL